MDVILREAAIDDIDEAYEWYESRRRGLGDEFLAALVAVRERILEYPEGFPVLRRDTRRALLPLRFPYALYYRLEGDVIVIVACMHASQDPRQWQRRR